MSDATRVPAQPPVRPLAELVGLLRRHCTVLAVRGAPEGVAVRAVTFDDRDAVPGAVHFCLVGERADGHHFAASARRRGAVAFVVERGLGSGAEGAVEILLAPGEARRAMALASCWFYGDPARALSVVGVTGTNGKTTTTHLVASILEAHGWPTVVIGTLGGPRTTPEAPALQAALAAARDRGAQAVAMEVTSHGLARHRVDGIVFEVAVFTNLTQDHLDYHGDMESYFAAKALLFDPERSRRAVVNADDRYGRRLLARRGDARPFSLADASELSLGPDSSSFRLRGTPVRLPLPGRFNVVNALAAAAAAEELGVPVETVAEGLARARVVPGRLERIGRGSDPEAYVDYAHTPGALEAVLEAARSRASQAGGRVVVVFGCGGERDRAKRPLMGAVASRLADLVVVTSDNPRHEDPAAIISEVLAGAGGPAEVLVEGDRAAAIALALGRCGPGDVLVVAGKGHETTQEVGDERRAFDDREVLRALLREREGRG